MKILKKITIKQWLGIIALIGIILLIIFGLKKKQDNAYSSFTVTTTTVSDQLLLAGTIDAKDRVDLGFAASGRVKKVNFQVGDLVQKGDIIAEIEQNQLSSQLSQAQANYALTRVNTRVDLDSATENLDSIIAEQNAIVEGLYREYLSGDLQAYNINENERNVIPPLVSGTYFGSTEGEYRIDLYSSAANSGYSLRTSGLESGTFTGQSAQPGALGSQGLYIQLIDGQSYNNTDWIIPVPNTRSSTYATRKRAYESALTTRDRIITDAQNNLNRVSSVDTQTTLSRDEALRAQARAQVNAVSAQLSDGKIRAPFDGIVAKNDLELGEIVNAFTPEVVIFGGQEKELNLNVPEIYINKIALGDSVSVILDAYEDIDITGVVDFIDVIDTEVDGVPVYQTDIGINIIDERIRSGMNAKARIISEEREDILAIPAHYITQKDNGDQMVIIKTGDRPNEREERSIVTGLRGNDGLVEIINGLQEGDIILLENK